MAQSAVAMALPAARLAMPELAGTIQVVDQGGKMLTTVFFPHYIFFPRNYQFRLSHANPLYVALSADHVILKL